MQITPDIFLRTTSKTRILLAYSNTTAGLDIQFSENNVVDLLLTAISTFNNTAGSFQELLLASTDMVAAEKNSVEHTGLVIDRSSWKNRVAKNINARVWGAPSNTESELHSCPGTGCFQYYVST